MQTLFYGFFGGIGSLNGKTTRLLPLDELGEGTGGLASIVTRAWVAIGAAEGGDGRGWPSG